MKKRKLWMIAGFLVVLVGGAFVALTRPSQGLDLPKPTRPLQDRVPLTSVEGDNKGVALIQDMREPFDEINHGTGFVVGENTLLTNKHVVSACADDVSQLLVRLKQENGEFLDFKVKELIMAPGDDQDLAMVKVEPLADGRTINDVAPTLTLASKKAIEQVKQTDYVRTVGYPADKAYGSLWESEGEVLLVGGNVLIYNAVISGGNSGSPVFNEAGQVIGLTNACNDEEGENYVTYGFLLNNELYDFVQKHL